jgi:UDP-N-acetyl-D-mannosaminuronic acid dehydrogenase
MDIVIIGGCGHVGLPLGLAFADKGKSVLLYDINEQAIETIRRGELPFIEYDAEPILKRVIGKNLTLTSNPADISQAKYVIVAIGTPVDEYLNPKLRALLDAFDRLRPHLRPNQTIVIRSTVYPRTNAKVKEALERGGKARWKVAYAPERIAQGSAIRELRELPQIVAGTSPEAEREAVELFSTISPSVMPVTIDEAELAKLFSNAWRYIQFAVANQFYMMSTDLGVDYDAVRRAMVEGYGRAAGLPGAGFAAGPCLLKDTMQLAAFNHTNAFPLGQAAMHVNEGLPAFLVEQLRRKYDLTKTRVGILGMTYKADIDDTRDALSYKLGKILRFHGATVSYSDEFAKDPTFVSKEELVANADVVIVGVPHSAYKSLRVPVRVEIIDPWNVIPRDSVVAAPIDAQLRAGKKPAKV